MVRAGALELPSLQKWNPSLGALQLGDWLLILGPVALDMTTTSEEWWTKLNAEAEGWYQCHMQMSSLDRVHNKFQNPKSLENPDGKG